MPSARPFITLLTDFGDRDYFVASMKGRILSIHPDAVIVDLSHQIAAHHVAEAGYVLQACYGTFPPGTVHVAVVDPGVGTARRPLLVTTPRFSFLAPDNGLLSAVLRGEPDAEVRQIENARFRIASPGATFDGRDLFAPAAAWLAKGEPPESFGCIVTDPVMLAHDQPLRQGNQLIGHIVYIDRFGNLISDITSQQAAALRAEHRAAAVTLRLAGHQIHGLVDSYSEGSIDRLCGLINSNGVVELFLKEGHAAGRFGLSAGAELRLSPAGQ